VQFYQGGLVYADQITTVSPTYARGNLRIAGGMGPEGLPQSTQGASGGHLNGIQSESWDPACDPTCIKIMTRLPCREGAEQVRIAA